MRYQLKLTPKSRIWTGDYRGENNRFLITGLKGSLRWWYETLIRGLNGYACDPTDDNSRCELNFIDQNETEDFVKCAKKKDNEAQKIVKKKICPACYLFGCNGWKSRFGLGGLPANEQEEHAPSLLEQENTYMLQIIERCFFPLEDVETGLLTILFSFISTHGSICAKNTLIPSEDPAKNFYAYHNGNRHGNFGLCCIVLQKKDSSLTSPVDKKTVQLFIGDFTGKSVTDNLEEWPNFKNIWYDSKLITRPLMRQIVNRQWNNRLQPDDRFNKSKLYDDNTVTNDDRWYGGEQKKSKKIFAFHTTDTSETNPRIWGYIKPHPNRPNTFIERKLRVLGQATSLHWGVDFLSAKGIL